MQLSCSEELMIVVCAAPSILSHVKNIEGESYLFSVGGSTVDMCCMKIIHRALAYPQMSTGQGHSQAALHHANQQRTDALMWHKGWVSQCMCFQVSSRVSEAHNFAQSSEGQQRLSCSAGRSLSSCQCHVLFVISTCLHNKACDSAHVTMYTDSNYIM